MHCINVYKEGSGGRLAIHHTDSSHSVGATKPQWWR